MANPFNQRTNTFGMRGRAAGGGGVRGFPTSPPGNPFMWTDYTDPSTLFQDTAGTIPVVEGSVIQRIDNKGFNPQDLQDASSTLQYRENIINGLSVCRGNNFPTVEFDDGLIVNGIGPPGITFAAIGRLLSNPGFEGLIRWAGGAPGGETVFRNTVSDWAIGIGDPTINIVDALSPVTIDEWVWILISYGPNGVNWDISGGGTSGGPVGAAFTGLGAAGFIRLMEVNGEMPEAIWWDVELSNPDRANVIGYFTGKYGAFPQ